MVTEESLTNDELRRLAEEGESLPVHLGKARKSALIRSMKVRPSAEERIAWDPWESVENANGIGKKVFIYIL